MVIFHAHIFCQSTHKVETERKMFIFRSTQHSFAFCCRLQQGRLFSVLFCRIAAHLENLHFIFRVILTSSIKFSLQVGVVEFLLNNGADVHAKDKVSLCLHCDRWMNQGAHEGLGFWLIYSKEELLRIDPEQSLLRRPTLYVQVKGSCVTKGHSEQYNWVRET